MGTRRESVTEFLAGNGFGEFGQVPSPSFPEYPPLNAELAVLVGKHGAEDVRVQLIIDLLRRARQEHEMGSYVKEQEFLAQAQQHLNQLSTDPRTKMLIIAVIIILGGLTLWAMTRKKKKRLPGRRKNSRARALALDDDEDDDEVRDQLDDEDDE